MATNKPVWGIDLGQNALKAVRLRLAGDVAEAVDYAYIEHSRILSSQQDAAARAGMVAETMKKFLENHNLSKETIVVAVPGQHTLARFVKLPPTDNKKKLPELVKYEAQQQIPFDMEEVIWDYQIFGNTPEGTEVGIFAMRREVLREHLRFLSDLNLEPAAVQSAPLALYSALRFDGILASEPGVILDIGAQNSDLIICEGDSLWTRNIPIGGNHFTESLMKTFKLSFNKAENLKRTAASSKYARQIFQAMRPVFADLVAEIQRSIGFFTGQRRGVKLAKVVAMGNAFQLPGMVKFIQQNLGMDVVRPTSFSKLSASEAPNAPDLLKQLGTFGVAYGLALQGLNKAQITSNLLPTEVAQQIVWRKKTPWFYGAAACLVLSASVLWVRNLADSKAIADVRDAAQAQPPTFSTGSEEVGGLKVPTYSQQAQDFLNDLSSVQNPLGKARTILAVSQHLSAVEQELNTINDRDIQRIKDMSKFETYKAVWPKILYKLHSALPENEVTRALAEGPDAYKLVTSKVARGERQIIFIERMRSAYSDDVVAAYSGSVPMSPFAVGVKDSMGGGGGGGGEAAAPGSPLPGFVISIEGRTPNAGRSRFINETFLARLAKDKTTANASSGDQGAQASTDVYFDRVYLADVKQIKDTLRQEGGGTGYRPGGPVYPGQAGAGVRDETKDPLTGESVVEDSMFRIVFVAVLGQKPAAAPAQPAASID